jgi:hypothetical protein
MFILASLAKIRCRTARCRPSVAFCLPSFLREPDIASSFMRKSDRKLRDARLDSQEGDEKMVRYRSHDRVELNVTRLERSRKFHQKIVGLQSIGPNPDGSESFLCGSDDCVVVLHESPIPGFRSVSSTPEDGSAFEGLHRQLRAHEVLLLSA